MRKLSCQLSVVPRLHDGVCADRAWDTVVSQLDKRHDHCSSLCHQTHVDMVGAFSQDAAAQSHLVLFILFPLIYSIALYVVFIVMISVERISSERWSRHTYMLFLRVRLFATCSLICILSLFCSCGSKAA